MGKPWAVRAGTFCFLALLYVVGAWHWHAQFASAVFHAKDWALVAKYHGVLRDAFAHASMPYLMSYDDHYTDRFLALPEVPLSPQFLLLPWFSDATFHRVNILLLYTVGFAGLLLIRRQLRLSTIPFVFVFLVFNMNGYIISRVTAGQTMWYGYFLLPFFYFHVLKLVKGTLSERSRIMLVLVLFLMMLQGSFHVYTWCLMFLVAIAMFNPGSACSVFYVILGALAVCLFRFIPAAVTFKDARLPFITGFPSLSFYLDALTTLHGFQDIRTYGAYDLGWWEFDAYIGIAGLGLLVYYSVLIRFREPADRSRYEYRELDLPVLLFLLLCFERVYALAASLTIPLLSAQRISARFIVIPLTLGAILAARRMHQHLKEEHPRLPAKVFLAIALVLMAWSLYDHAAAWRIYDADRYFLNEHPYGRDAAYIVPVPTDDPNIRRYVHAVQCSIVLSICAWIGLVVRFVKAAPLDGDASLSG